MLNDYIPCGILLVRVNKVYLFVVPKEFLNSLCLSFSFHGPRKVICPRSPGHHMAEVRLEPLPPPHTCTHLGLSLPGALLNCCSEAHRDQVNSLNKNFFFDGIVFVHDVLKSCPVRGLTSSILCHCSIHYCCFEMVAQCVALGALELSSAHQCRPCWP